MPPSSGPAERILGVRKARAYEIQREIAEHGGLDAWFCQKVLEGISAGRIGRGRETLPSQLADAFFIALAGGEAEARSCALPRGQCQSRIAESGLRRTLTQLSSRCETTWSTPASSGASPQTRPKCKVRSESFPPALADACLLPHCSAVSPILQLARHKRHFSLFALNCPHWVHTDADPRAVPPNFLAPRGRAGQPLAPG